MNNGLKLFWLTGLVSAFGAMTLQGCGDDGGTDDGSGGSAAGSGGSSSGGSAGKGGSSSGGSSSGGSAGKGGSSSGGSAGSTGGSSQGGDGPGAGGDGPGAGGDGPGAGGDGPGAGGEGNLPTQQCQDFCMGENGVVERCDGIATGELSTLPGCLAACAQGLDDIGCYTMHLGFIVTNDYMGEELETHCGHATGAENNGQCDEL